jgi:hypothetical protein
LREGGVFLGDVIELELAAGRGNSSMLPPSINVDSAFSMRLLAVSESSTSIIHVIDRHEVAVVIAFDAGHP